MSRGTILRGGVWVLSGVLWVEASRAETARYSVDAERSRVSIHVGKAGAFKFAGHEHDVIARLLEGEVVAVPEDLGRSTVKLRFETAGLRVSEKGEPAGDAPKVQETMLGPKLLDAERHPSIAFVSTEVTGKAASAAAYELEVSGDLTLHGTTRRVKLPVRVELKGETLEATGRLPLEQTAFGLKPVSAGAGTVKVKDEVRIDFSIVAKKSP